MKDLGPLNYFLDLSLRQKTPFETVHLQRFSVKNAVNGFTAVVKRKPLLSLQRFLANNRCKIIYSGF
jgi:hypothetical protein